MASTSSVGRHGWLPSTGQQWYTTPSKTDNARMRTAPVWRAGNGKPSPSGPGQARELAGRRRAGQAAAMDGDDDAQLARYARALADGVDRALAGWVVRVVEGGAAAQRLRGDAALRRRAEAAGEEARAEIVPRLRRLLDADIDEQRTGPLAVIRGATRYPTGV